MKKGLKKLAAKITAEKAHQEGEVNSPSGQVCV